MKKNNTPIIVTIVVVVVLAVIAAVVIIVNNRNGGDTGDSDDTGGQSSENNSNTSNNNISPSEKVESNSIVGQWKYDDSDFSGSGMDFVYTFNANGTGNYAAAGTDMPFTYVADGSQLTITYESGVFETEYEINGDILNVKDSGGSDTLYKRVK